MDADYIYALLTLLFCAGIAWACVCRLNMIKSHHPTRVLVRYSLLLTVAVVYGLAPVLLQEWPGSAGTVFSGGVFSTMVLSLRQGYLTGRTPRTRIDDLPRDCG